MRLGKAFSAVLLLACAATVQACSSCSKPDGQDGTSMRGAYYVTAIFLTLLPMGLVALLVLWVRRAAARPHA